MKNKNIEKRVLAVILSVMFIATTLSVSVLAYGTNVDITNVVAPFDGETPTYTATVEGYDFELFEDTFGYVIDGVTWYDLTEDSNMDKNDTFIEGHVYKVSVLVVPTDDGYWSLQTATINGEEAEVSEADDFYIVAYTFGEMPEISDDETADITITAPIAGQIPSYNATIGNECFEVMDLTENYIYNGVTWYDLTMDSNIDNDDVFIDYHSYRVTILVKKAEGVELELLRATINGKDAEIGFTEDDYGNPYYLIAYDFGDKPIDPDETVNITITEPVSGEKPSYNATIDNECFEFFGEDFGYVYNGVTWFDDTFGTNLDKDDVFYEAHQYTVTFLVVKAEGVELELLHANVNRNAAELYEADEYYLVSYEFYIGTDKQIVESVNIFHISEPAPGYTFDYTATLSGAGYKTKNINNETTINGISWFDYTAESFVNTTDICVEGHDYAVIIHLEAKDGYILLPQAVYINGEERGFSYYGIDITTEAYFEYIDPIIREIELTDVEKPVQGYYPDYDITTDSDRYMFTNKNDAYFNDGVAWFDVTDGKYLEKDLDAFVGGHIYMLEIYLTPADNFTFNLTSVTLNGDRLTDIWGSGSRVVLYYTFEPCEAPTDIKVNININNEHLYSYASVYLINPKTYEVVYNSDAFYDYGTYEFTCEIYSVYPTDYIMAIEYEGCATRNYYINVSSYEYEFDAELCTIGDVNMDGTLDVNDFQSIVNYALDDSEIPFNTSSDAKYQLALADCDQDGVIDVLDCHYAEKNV